MTLLCLLLASPALGAADAEPVFAAARGAVREGRVDRTRALGFQASRRTFSELPPQGALLVGFDLGVGKFRNIETVYALRPVYQTALGEDVGDDHGLFRDRWLAVNKTLKSKVVRTVRVVARPGYAVGAITLRSGLNINGLSLTFMRVDGRSLDPGQSYTSDWVGDRTGGREASVGGEGGPVIGVFGSEDDVQVRSLGLYFFKPPAAAAQPPAVPPRPQKPAEPPPAPPGVERPAVLPAAVPAGPEDPAPLPAPAAPTAAPARGQGVPGWLPFAVFGAVSGLVFLVLAVASARKKRVVVHDVGKMAALPGPLPGLTPSPAPTAVCERPRPKTRPPAEALRAARPPRRREDQADPHSTS
jgi:hypothetical protein